MARLMDLNFMGTFLVARAALPHLKRQPEAHLQIMSSIVGQRGLAYGGAYSATKFAQVGLAESLRAELLGTNVHVSVICPVSTETEFRDAMAREQGFAVSGHGPRQSADFVARAMVRCLRRPKRRGLPASPLARARHPQRARARPLRSRHQTLRPQADPRRRDRSGGRGERDERGRRAERNDRDRRIGRDGLIGRRGRIESGGSLVSSELDTALSIARAVRDAGGRALIVGGWVRDKLLGRDAKDIDLEVYGLSADRLKDVLAAFGSVNTVGESFTVYKVADLDVSLPRRESKVGRGHRGFEVTGDPHLSVEEAARRRDFTINAIAWDPLTGEYLDPHDGRADLERRVLRAVDVRTFGEDSLRVLRAVQFAARFDCTLDPATFDLCRIDPARRSPVRTHLG